MQPENEEVIDLLKRMKKQDEETGALDGTLATLRKHGVTEYSQDQYGIRVKFAEKTPDQIINQVIAEALERPDTSSPIPGQELPEPGAVDFERTDLDDVLFGAK